jgi:hypothetical protein
MAEATPTPETPLQLIDSDADGYCDPVTGVCAVPGTVPSAEQQHPKVSGDSDR